MAPSLTPRFRLPQDIPLAEYPSPETYLAEARWLIDAAQQQGLILRVMGPIALHTYFPDYVDLYRRLEIHPHCVSLTDLLLQKLQIVFINDKDLKDAMLLLLAAPLDESDQQAINVRYVARLFADDWGFYYTATTNLGKAKAAAESVAALDAAQRAAIGAKADQLLETIEAEPKSGRWKRRQKVGAKKPWYNEVSDWV